MNLLSQDRAIRSERLRKNAARAALVVILSTAAFGVAGKHQVHAQSATAGPSFGSVDVQKVLDGYNKKASTESDFQKVVDHYGASYKILQANYMLSSTDIQTLSGLLLKDQPTPADSAQVQALETKSQNDANELTALQQKQNLTDTDKARLSTLTQEQSAGQQALQAAGDQYKQTLEGKNQQESQVIADQVRTAVAAIAKSKGLTMVFDSSVVLYAANDVTQPVLDKLNSGK